MRGFNPLHPARRQHDVPVATPWDQILADAESPPDADVALTTKGRPVVDNATPGRDAVYGAGYVTERDWLPAARFPSIVNWEVKYGNQHCG